MDIAEKIVAGIEHDFRDRRGLRQEWEWIDDDIQAEIRLAWADIVWKIISESNAATRITTHEK